MDPQSFSDGREQNDVEENKCFPFTQEGDPLKEWKLTRVTYFQNRIKIHCQETLNNSRSALSKAPGVLYGQQFVAKLGQVLQHRDPESTV